MKIAIIKPTETISPTNGVKVQCEMWKRGLEECGHEVTLVSDWSSQNWKEFDCILFVQFGGILRGLANALYCINPNLAIAPIIDTNFSNLQFKLLCKYYGSCRLKLSNIFHDFYKVRNMFKLYLVRSKYEKLYVTRSLGIPEERVKIVPLPYRVEPPTVIPEKENFCFHASLLADKRKNVERLICAAHKYKFKLVLAGNLRTDAERQWLHGMIDDYDNISYIGRVSDEVLFNHYRRAKVFALPSINEGVGMVALEASTYGCEIVITNLGAPKEYYDGLAYLVNPYSVDSIGKAICKALSEEENKQPHLREHIINNYDRSRCNQLLNEALRNTMK